MFDIIPTVITLYWDKEAWANSVVPVQTSQNACFPLVQQYFKHQWIVEQTFTTYKLICPVYSSLLMNGQTDGRINWLVEILGTFIFHLYNWLIGLFIHLFVHCPLPFWRKKSGGTLFLVIRGAWCLVRGVWFRIFSRYFVPLTPPTVFVRSFWNFTGVLRMVWRCTFFEF